MNYRVHEEEEEVKQKEAPQFVTKPEPYVAYEGDCARFCCRVTGYPRPRVMWLINGKTVVNVSTNINRLRYRKKSNENFHIGH